MHGRQHLHVIHRVKTKTARDMILYKIHNDLDNFFRIILPHEVKIGEPVTRGSKIGDLPPVDAVGVADDLAFRRLAENFHQFHYRHGPGSNEIAKHIARPHGRKLMDVAHKDHRGPERRGLQKMIGEHRVHHGRFIHNQKTASQRVVLIAGKAVLLGAVFQQAMNGARFAPACLGHAFGRPPGGRGKQNLGLVFSKNLDDGIENRGLARTRTAGKHHHFRGGGRSHRFQLLLGQIDAEPGHHAL